MSLALAQPQIDAIAIACRQHQVLRMHLFGSALHDDFDPSRSDLDLLVEFQPIEPGALVKACFGLGQQRAVGGGVSVGLLAFNAERHAEEVVQGPYSKASKKAAGPAALGDARRGVPPKAVQAGETEQIGQALCPALPPCLDCSPPSTRSQNKHGGPADPWPPPPRSASSSSPPCAAI